MTGEGLKFKGSFEAVLRDESGRVKDYRLNDNLITTVGFDGVAQRMFSTETGSNAWNYIAIGSGTTAAAAGDTALGSEAARAQGTYAHTDGTDNLSLTNTFAAGTATGSIAESGIFNSGATGVLFNRQTFGVIVKGASDSLQITWAGSLS